MANEQDRKVIHDWVARLTDVNVKQRQYVNSNVYAGDVGTIYSYGQHFPMAMVLEHRNVDGKPWVWLNGDRYSPTTTTHQNELRNELLRAGIPAINVPREALTAARIDIHTIVPGEVQAERFDYTEHVSPVPPGYKPVNASGNHVAYGGEYVGTSGAPDHWRHQGVGGRDYNGTDTIVGVTTGGNEGFNQQVVYTNGINYRWHTVKHWLGDAVFTANVSRWVLDGGVTDDPTPVPTRSLQTERLPFISSFDHQETRPLYFLSELPEPARTVEHGIELLMPESVSTAISLGRTVVRQGDMFAIPMGISTRELTGKGAVFEKKGKVITHWVSETEYTPVPNGDGWHIVGGDGRCEVCYRWVDQMAVPHAYNQCTSTTSEQVHIPRYGVSGASLMGTAHTATEVATLPDGRQYARGCLYHAPSIIGEHWREADHKRQPLGKVWHLIARNTVPVTS